MKKITRHRLTNVERQLDEAQWAEFVRLCHQRRTQWNDLRDWLKERGIESSETRLATILVRIRRGQFPEDRLPAEAIPAKSLAAAVCEALDDEGVAAKLAAIVARGCGEARGQVNREG